MPRKSILITSVGSQVGEGIIASLQHRRDHLHIAGVNSLAKSPAVYACDSAYLVPAIQDIHPFHARLGEILEQATPDLVIPGRDDDIVVLARLAETDERLSGRVLAGPAPICGILRNKLMIAQFAKSHGLPFVETYPTSAADLAHTLVDTHGWPILVKPEEGQGSQDIWLLDDWEKLAKWLGKPGFVMQPYLDSTEMLRQWLGGFERGVPLHSSAPGVVQDVVQVIIGPHGDQLGSFGMQTDMVAGRSWRVMPNQDPPLLELGMRFGQALAGAGWRGPLNIQTKRIGSHYIPFEINGRFNGTTSARTALGFDEVRLTLGAFLGLDIGPQANPPAERVLRRACDHALDHERAAILEARGEWHAA